MRRYIVIRLLQGLLLLFSVSVLVFSMLYMMPGDPIDQVTDYRASREKKEELRIQYGFDQPLYKQYLNWGSKVLQGDFGNSIRHKLSVGELMKVRIPITLKLTGLMLLIEMLISVPLGLLCAYKKDSFIDRLIVNISLLFTAIPNFWIAVLLILFFGVSLKWFPVSGYDSAKHMVLPVATGVLGSFAGTIRITKSEVLDVIREKYVTTAYAKGLSRSAVLIRHVLRNSLILITVLVALSIPWLLSGSVIIEHIFGIPGMGGLLINSILVQDFPIVQACVLAISALTVLFNILCDLLLGLLDPRISLALKGSDS